MIAGVFEVPAWVLAWLYSFTNNYAAAIALIAVLVMLLVTPLNLKSTKGMLEMQRLAPEMRKLQNEHRGDRQKLNEEMMKLYQEHKVNPMASCLPLVAQMPVFIIMFRILHGMTYEPRRTEQARRPGGARRRRRENTTRVGFLPRYLPHGSDALPVARSQDGDEVARARSVAVAGRDARRQLRQRPRSTPLLVVVLGGLYFFQQRMVAARAAVSPTMSPGQQKLMQYLPVVFAVFQIFFLLGLVVYYIVQSVLRIAQQYYITKRFYGHDEALGRQAQRPGERAREIAKQDGGGGGMLAQARRDLAESEGGKRHLRASSPAPASSPKRQSPRGCGRAGRRATRGGRPRPRAGRRRPTDPLRRGPAATARRAARSVEPQHRTEQTWNGWRRRVRRLPRPRRPPSTGSAWPTTTPSSRSSRNRRNGLFGLIRGEARVRARIRPTEARPKQERKRGRGDRSASRTDDA